MHACAWAVGEQLRETLNKQAKKDKEGNPAYKLSVNDFIIKASGWVHTCVVPAAWACSCLPLPLPHRLCCVMASHLAVLLSLGAAGPP